MVPIQLHSPQILSDWKLFYSCFSLSALPIPTTIESIVVLAGFVINIGYSFWLDPAPDPFPALASLRAVGRKRNGVDLLTAA